MMPELPRPGREKLRDVVGDRRQLASVRQVELCDGPEKGVRALVFSTGGGLDFWALQDRSMDIGTLHYRGLPVAWLHPAGFTNPGLRSPDTDGGTGVERSLGGFLVTCGLDNVRQPVNGLPLHGTLPFTPARLRACGEDWDATRPFLYAEAEMITAHLAGPSFRLVRRIEAPIAGTRLSIVDTVENIGPDPSDLKVLYHMNFGFPAVGKGTRLQLDDRAIPLGEVPATASEVTCHSAGGPDGRFRATLARPADGPWQGFEVEIAGDARELPFVQVWRDLRKRRNVLAVEPVNCDRNPDGTSGPSQRLEPGATWTARLDITFRQPSENLSSPHDGEE